jgi:peptidoglycan/xylan/chitin deacetylase (PgdA/CDA1 family)
MDLLCAFGWRTLCLRDADKIADIPLRGVIITFDDGYADNFAAFEELARRSMRATWFVVSRDIGKQSGWQDAGQKTRPMLDRSQLVEMHSAAMEIGAHGRTHTRLTKLDDLSLGGEVAGSKEDIEGMLGIEVDSFAYPYGDFDDRTVAAVRNAGYRKACITRPGWLNSDPDMLRIRRISIFAQDNLSAFARKLALADNDVRWRRMLRYGARRFAAVLGSLGSDSLRR